MKGICRVLGCTCIFICLYFNIFSLEFMVSPPLFYSDQSSFISDALDAFTFSPHVIIPDPVDTPPALEVAHTQCASRLGMTFNSVDLYLSYFHGFDRRLFYTTTTDVDLSYNLNIEIERNYTMVDKLGASISFDLFGLIINSEVVISYFDPVLHYETTIYPDPLGNIKDMKKTEVTSMEMSIGCDWEFDSNFRVIFEYNDYFLPDDVPHVLTETLNGDTLFCALLYTLSHSWLKITLMPGIRYDFGGNEITSINKIECDFLNGFVIEFVLFYFYIPEVTAATSDSFKIMNEDMLTGIFFTFKF